MNILDTKQHDLALIVVNLSRAYLQDMTSVNVLELSRAVENYDAHVFNQEGK